MSIPFIKNDIARQKYAVDTALVSTLGKKEVRINLKINPNLREEFQAAAHLRGASMSSILHQYIVKIVREEKERSMDDFSRALEFVRQVGPDEDGNRVDLSGASHGSSAATMDLTVTKPEPSGPLANHVYDAIAGTPKAVKGSKKGGGKGKKR